MRDEICKYRKFTRRALVLGVMKGILVSCLIGRFYYLQILKSDKYSTLSDKNRLRILLLLPRRGEITDARGVILAKNTKIYSLFIKGKYRNEIKNLVKKINDIIVGQKVNISVVSNKVKVASKIESIKLLENLLLQNAILLDSHPDLKEIEIKEEYTRKYPLEEYTFHITGYLGNIDTTNVTQENVSRYYGLLTGKDGVEKQFNDKLQGQVGVQKIEVDAKGNFVRKVDFIPSTPGEDIKLSIDKNVQEIIWQYLQGYTGAITVMDLDTKKIIGMVSTPTINTNVFTESISSEEWDMIKNQQGNPLINRCISAKYHPGSIFKLIVFLAILKQGLNPLDKVFCPGYYKLGSKTYSCWKKSGHGYVNLEEALSQSCNIYFFEQSLKIGIEKINDIATLLGLFQKTNIELPFETDNIMPDKRWKQHRYKTPWYLGDTINASIGQGYIGATPMQLLQMIARIATSSNLSPSIIHSEYNKDTENKLGINTEDLDKLKQAMLKVFYNPSGTGYRNRIEDQKYKIAGKSGTAQVIGKKHNTNNALYRDHSLFVGFAPFEKPKFAISTVIEHGGWGSKTAVPISKQILLDIKEY